LDSGKVKNRRWRLAIHAWREDKRKRRTKIAVHVMHTCTGNSREARHHFIFWREEAWSIWSIWSIMDTI
jgi:hypothetical protein